MRSMRNKKQNRIVELRLNEIQREKVRCIVSMNSRSGLREYHAFFTIIDEKQEESDYILQGS